MKSIANQYRDLKEGRMSQFNFMRNLRMSMPQYITNVTSFKDAVRILKNKAILTESGQGGPSIDQMSREEMINFLGTTASIVKDLTDDELRDIVKNKNADLGEAYDGPSEPIMGNSKIYSIDSQDRGETGSRMEFEVVKNTPEYFTISYKITPNSRYSRGGSKEGDTVIKKDPSLSAYQRKWIVIPGAGAFGPISDELYNMLYDTSTDDSELEDMISRMEDELDSPDKYKFQDFPGGISEGKKKKAKKEEKPYNPNAIHPSELRMGIRVEMEHTDDPKKAEKIALDHLAENPFYYTALKLSGVESPSAPKAPAPKKIKKKDATEMVDQANQMQKVKLMKEALEKLIRAELKKY